MPVEKITPLMKQYFDIRAQYPDTILLFQVGDFYELFFDDAKRVSSFLAIALTKRGKNNGQDIPLCGIPVHALNHYLLKLIKGGFKVAICDQLEKPQPGVVVKRGVTQVFTPGTLTDSLMLDEKSASYLFSFFPTKNNWGLVFTELLTAQLFATQIPIGSYRILESELIRFFPDEIILPSLKGFKNYVTYFRELGYLVSFAEYENIKNENDLDTSIVKEWIEKQFDSKIVNFLYDNYAILNTLQTIYCYFKKNQQAALNQFRNIQFYNPDDYLILDPATQRNLEIIKNNQDNTRKNSLLFVMDKSKTSMGSRTIKKWLLRPLIDYKKILQRLEVVVALSKKIDVIQQLEETLIQINDIERIIGRIALRRATLQDYVALKNSLQYLPKLKTILQQNFDFYLTKLISEKFLNFSLLVQFLDCSLNNEFSNSFIIKKGFDLKLDRLRHLVSNTQKEVLKLEQKEIERTSISSLKIRYNQVSGYYIEVTNPNLKFVPENYIEQQKLVNRKRFITQELKDLEHEIFKAKNEIEIVEKEVYEKIKNEVEQYLPSLRQVAQSLSYLDALYSFAVIAYENNYIQPNFNNKNEIIIKSGRHPVVEKKLENQFEPNDTNLIKEESLWLITGPNMGGKSTYLRQVALISIMAQCGSCVPATNASLPILDRIFTRIGSGDNLVEGKSTFLVEMEETAIICGQATKKSLVILDEVGRGTSTFDGIALAQSIIEYIFCKVKAKCLFATHYHELTTLQEKFDGIKNYYMMSKNSENQLIFLHKIAKGIAHGSFGLQVAKLAKLPNQIIRRADEILKTMQNKSDVANNKNLSNELFDNAYIDQNNINNKIRLLEQELMNNQKVLKSIQNTDLNNFSPKEAFDFLWDIKKSLLEDKK
ncbi:DNA mismatch repair protein MutS [Candidatus Dependentiae bacterium]|nr:DNA mismatch repair protein MutS [Candidatus Dependentiae bacterium]